jgi:DNA repair exonuclease SbcCD ATPase subunit
VTGLERQNAQLGSNLDSTRESLSSSNQEVLCPLFAWFKAHFRQNAKLQALVEQQRNTLENYREEKSILGQTQRDSQLASTRFDKRCVFFATDGRSAIGEKDAELSRMRAEAAALSKEQQKSQSLAESLQHQLDDANEMNNNLKNQVNEHKQIASELRNKLAEARMDADDQQARLDDEKVKFLLIAFFCSCTTAQADDQHSCASGTEPK